MIYVGRLQGRTVSYLPSFPPLHQNLCARRSLYSSMNDMCNVGNRRVPAMKETVIQTYPMISTLAVQCEALPYNPMYEMYVCKLWIDVTIKVARKL